MTEPKTVTRTGRVTREYWGPGDYYLAVNGIQVFEHDGFRRGDKVKITIRKMTQEEIDNELY